jgi:hypothetical protein
MERRALPDLDDGVDSRLRFDYQVVTAMSSPLMEVEAYRSLDDLQARRNPVQSVDEGHLATYYRVEYNIKTLSGLGRYSNKTTISYDLFGDNDYPKSEPVCFVISKPIPWSPHFHPETGKVCIGPAWEKSEGHMLLGELMAHVARLLNFDEPKYDDPDYGGWVPEAVDYWEAELSRQPITKNLPYPILPDLVYLDPEEAERAARPAPEPPKMVIRRPATVPTLPAATTPLIKLRQPGSAAGTPPRIIIGPRGQ